MSTVGGPPRVHVRDGEVIPASKCRTTTEWGAALWYELVDRDHAALTTVTTASRPVARSTFEPSDGGQAAVYMLRTIRTSGEKGLWSETALAAVAAQNQRHEPEQRDLLAYLSGANRTSRK